MKSLDRVLAALADGTASPHEFVIADAKDADMSFGVAAAGPLDGGGGRLQDDPDVRYRTRPEYQQAMRDVTAQGVVDVLLASASNAEVLAGEGAFASSSVTLAVRANDTTDIWSARGSGYSRRASVPFRTADLGLASAFCDLVHYSITFNNDLDADHQALEEYARFRAEARALGLRHLLEVFNPNAPAELQHNRLGPFVNDNVIRALAGVTRAERPLLLIMSYNGQRALGELVEHDPGLVVGIIGGSAGTSRDTFELLSRTQRVGARAALFGRKIQRAESQTELLTVMRAVLSDDLGPEDAVREYHRRLTGLGVAPYRALEDDLAVTDPALRLP